MIFPFQLTVYYQKKCVQDAFCIIAIVIFALTLQTYILHSKFDNTLEVLEKIKWNKSLLSPKEWVYFIILINLFEIVILNVFLSLERKTINFIELTYFLDHKYFYDYFSLNLKLPIKTF